MERELITSTDDGRIVVANATLRKLEGNAHAYFSLTGEEWANRRAYQRKTQSGLLSCGCVHETILEAYASNPAIEGLRHMANLHLSDEDGAPMYAQENGWYWYAQDHERGASYLRVRAEEMPRDLSRDAFYAYVETLRARWLDEARVAMAWLQGEGQ